MRNITTIVIHHSATQQTNLEKLLSSINRTHQARLHPKPNGFGNHIAYHYIINYDGEVKATRPLSEVGYHASNWGVNQRSIGICLSGHFDLEEPTSQHYKALRNLIDSLQRDLGKLEIRMHNEYSNKSCPGKNFSLSQLTNTLMLFYEKLRRDNHTETPEDERMFKNPDAFIARTKSLPIEDQLSEMTFLIAILSEKLGKRC